MAIRNKNTKNAFFSSAIVVVIFVFDHNGIVANLDSSQRPRKKSDEFIGRMVRKTIEKKGKIVKLRESVRPFCLCGLAKLVSKKL